MAEESTCITNPSFSPQILTFTLLGADPSINVSWLSLSLVIEE